MLDQQQSSIAGKVNLFLALDIDEFDKIKVILPSLEANIQGIKVGLEFLYMHGWQKLIEIRQNYQLFIDVKLHDIPNTVAKAVRALVRNCHPNIITVHAAGGGAMLKSAVLEAQEEAYRLSIPAPNLIAVTVLTSLEKNDLNDIGWPNSSLAQVLQLAKLAFNSGVNGVVCSGQEVGLLRAVLGPKIRLIVPGIRPDGDAAFDQKRITTPTQAILDGATDLVVGRPIINASNPPRAAQLIQQQITDAVCRRV